MHLSTTLFAFTALLAGSVQGCLYFNATLAPNHNRLTVFSWDDANNNNASNPEDIRCEGTNLSPRRENYWSVPCRSQIPNAQSDTVFDVFLDKDTGRFLDIIYRYSNPGAQGLQEGANDQNPDEFYYNFRVGSVDGLFFKSREFCAQYDLFRLIKPEALKNPCDSLDSC